jgi:predicted RNA-binding Zn-ribbon protein involved in translation (DUF1610 family)
MFLTRVTGKVTGQQGDRANHTSMTDKVDMETRILSQPCPECADGRFQRGTTEIEFSRTYDDDVAVEFRISSVPALVCDACKKEVIIPSSERRVWEIVSEIESSREFNEILEQGKQLVRHTRVKRARQFYNVAYAEARAS